MWSAAAMIGECNRKLGSLFCFWVGVALFADMGAAGAT